MTPGRAYQGPECPHCGEPLVLLPATTDAPGRCFRCHGDFASTRFAAALPVPRVKSLSEAGPEGANACPLHAGNAVSDECARCGLYLCGLCATPAEGQTYCTACFERLADEHAFRGTRAEEPDWTMICTSATALSVLFFLVAPLTGPLGVVAAVFALRQRKAHGDRGRRWGLWAAMAVSALLFAAASAFWLSESGWLDR